MVSFPVDVDHCVVETLDCEVCVIAGLQFGKAANTSKLLSAKNGSSSDDFLLAVEAGDLPVRFFDKLGVG